MGCWVSVTHLVISTAVHFPAFLFCCTLGSYAVCVFALTLLIKLAAMKQVKQIKSALWLACVHVQLTGWGGVVLVP
jgi:hypothetical protein